MSRQQGKSYAELCRFGAIVRMIEPGKTVGVALPDKFVTITAERYEDRQPELTPQNYMKCVDEAGSISQEEWEELGKLILKDGITARVE